MHDLSRLIRTTLATMIAVAAGVSAAAAQPSGPLSVPPPGKAATEKIPMLRDVGIDQTKLNNHVPFDATFVDEAGREVTFGQYFGTRPVVLVLAYYECPMLCTQVLNGSVGSLEALTFNPGNEYDVVVVSFDPGETPAMAARKRESWIKRLGRPGTEAGVHFLTGRPESIAALTQAVGFKYAYDQAIDQYAHPAVMTILTKDGRVSRYLFGIEFAPVDVRLALVEAADNKIGSVIDQVLLFCYHYDPETGSYGFAIMTIVRAAGILTVLAIAMSIFLTLRRDRRQATAVTPTATGTR
jgi:protein SCO1/2